MLLYTLFATSILCYICSIEVSKDKKDILDEDTEIYTFGNELIKMSFDDTSIIVPAGKYIPFPPPKDFPFQQYILLQNASNASIILGSISGIGKEDVEKYFKDYKYIIYANENEEYRNFDGQVEDDLFDIIKEKVDKVDMKIYENFKDLDGFDNDLDNLNAFLDRKKLEYKDDEESKNRYINYSRILRDVLRSFKNNWIYENEIKVYRLLFFECLCIFYNKRLSQYSQNQCKYLWFVFSYLKSIIIAGNGLDQKKKQLLQKKFIQTIHVIFFDFNLLTYNENLFENKINEFLLNEFTRKLSPFENDEDTLTRNYRNSIYTKVFLTLFCDFPSEKIYYGFQISKILWSYFLIYGLKFGLALIHSMLDDFVQKVVKNINDADDFDSCVNETAITFFDLSNYSKDELVKKIFPRALRNLKLYENEFSDT